MPVVGAFVAHKKISFSGFGFSVLLAILPFIVEFLQPNSHCTHQVAVGDSELCARWQPAGPSSKFSPEQAR